MSEAIDVPGPITRIALAAAPKLLHLMVPAALLLVASGFLANPLVAAAGLAAGVTLFAIAGVIAFIDRSHRARHKDVLSAAQEVVEEDKTPCYLTHPDGTIRYANPAATARFGLGVERLRNVLDPYLASAEDKIGGLCQDALSRGAARYDITAGQAVLHIAVHRISGGALMWRLEEHRQTPAQEETSALGLPMMKIAKPTSAVVAMNSAMRALIGHQPATLDRIVAKLPLASGVATEFTTLAGPVIVYPAIVECGEGEQMIYLWPEAAPEVQRSGADSIPVPLMRISPAGEILMANIRAKKLLALPDGPKGQALEFPEVIEGLGRPIDEWLLDVSEGRGAGRTEVVRAALPKQDVFLQVSLGRMVDRGEVSILAVLIDATELKTLEAQFVQSQKMQAIGQLAGGVAHDFNNLLTAISGHCDLLLLRHEPGDPNYGDLIQINQNANRAASLVGQLLAFSRKQNLQPELIDLRETLVDLTHLLNRLVGEKIHLRWTHDPNLPRVRADKRQLEQVIMNLVVNARDAMAGGGAIHVETTATSLQDSLQRDRAEIPPGDYVLVKVRDEGCGIAETDLQKIFEPFWSTKKTGEGTGLGLSMVYGIVKQSGGFIFAESELGRGSTFTMFFPAHHDVEAVAVKSPKAAQKALTLQEGGNVLLVEDEAPVRAFASRALRLRGYTVTEAACAEDALDLLDDPELEIDVFVTDVVMPGMDGPTWVSKALEDRPDVKVVFVSGYAEDSVSHNRAKIPNSMFLPKPFSLNQLTETVQAQLS